MSLFDVLHVLGQATWQPVWVPILAWTVLALPLWALMQRSERLHPLADYRLSQVLLVSLPLGILAAATTDLFAFSSPVAPLVDLNAPPTALPSVPESISFPDGSPDGSGTGRPWHWTHAVGALTIVAAGVVVARLGQLALEVVAVLRIDTFSYTPQDATLMEEAKQLAEALGVARSFHVRASGKATVPLTVGGMIPTIILPRNLAEQDEDRKMALRHELVHVRRYDDLARLAERTLAALFAFHPMVSPVCTQIDWARERACDAVVLEGARTTVPSYARLLFSFAGGAKRPRQNGVSLFESPSLLTDRIDAMRAPRSPFLSSRTGRTATVALASVLLIFGVAACSDMTADREKHVDGSPTQSVAASETALTGRVVNEQTGEPIPRVNVIEAYEDDRSDDGTIGRGIATTGENGEFRSRKLTPGSHRVLVSSVGYEDMTKTVTLKSGKTERVTFELSRKTKSLPSVTVNAQGSTSEPR